MKTIFAFFMLVGISLWETEAFLETETLECVVDTIGNSPELLAALIEALCTSGSDEDKNEANKQFGEKLSRNEDSDCDLLQIFGGNRDKDSDNSDGKGVLSENIAQIGKQLGLSGSLLKTICNAALPCLKNLKALKRLEILKLLKCEPSKINEIFDLLAALNCFEINTEKTIPLLLKEQVIDIVKDNKWVSELLENVPCLENVIPDVPPII